MKFLIKLILWLIKQDATTKRFDSIIKKLKPRSDYEKLFSKHSEKRIGTYRYGRFGSFKKFWDILTPNEKEKIRQAFLKEVLKGNKTTIIKEYQKSMEQVNRTLLKMVKDEPISKEDLIQVEIFKALHIAPKGATYIPLKSSWLLQAKYTKSSKTMWVQMARGKVIYKFPNVPDIAYLALISAHTKTAGKTWWDEWYWRYSTNPRWNKKRRK